MKIMKEVINPYVVKQETTFNTSSTPFEDLNTGHL